MYICRICIFHAHPPRNPVALPPLQVILRVQERRAFMSPMKLAIMPHLLELYDFTTVIEPATLGFSMAKPTLKPRWQSLYYPLTEGVWASILAVLALVPVALILVRLRSSLWDFKGW